MIDGDLGKIFRQFLPDFHFQRIETGGTGRGIPDTNYATKEQIHEFDSSHGDTLTVRVPIEGWIEYKVTDGWAVTLRPEQIGWLSRRARLGCRVWVAVRRRCAVGKRRAAADELHLIPGGLAAMAADHGLKDLPEGPGGVSVWAGGPAAWDWQRVRELLTE